MLQNSLYPMHKTLFLDVTDAIIFDQFLMLKGRVGDIDL